MPLDAFEAGFAYAQKLADPAFRERLRAMGATSGAVLPAGPDTTVANVLNRAVRAGRYLLVVADDYAPDGWRLAWLEVPDV